MRHLFLALICGLPLVASATPTTVTSVDLNRYSGKWYEVAAIPQFFQRQCVANTTAEYSLADDGQVRVFNSCDKDNGERTSAEGHAKVVDTATNSKLKVTFLKLFCWLYLFGGDYWILDLAPDYSYALVGSPDLQYAWILARTPSLSLEILTQIEQTFKAQGYDTCQILTSVQDGGFTSRDPLCKIVASPTGGSPNLVTPTDELDTSPEPPEQQ